MGAQTIDQIDIERETIGNALKVRWLYVPNNQRAYKWQTEHINDLYNDFARAIGQGDPEYFLGSIVVVQSEANGRIEVNDGQQRLATSMILIAAIRDYFIKLGDHESADAVETEYLSSRDRRTHEQRPHLHLNSVDHDFFIKRIVARPGTAERQTAKKTGTDRISRESHKRIANAATLAAARVRSIASAAPSGEEGAVLHKWLDFIELGARVIWVQVANARTAYVIFETMNDRGLKLTAADLLKNYILSKAEDREDEAFAKWNSMTAVLEAVGDDEDVVVEFIRYHWVTENGIVRSRDLFDKIKEQVKNKTKALDLTITLEARARDYAAILIASHEKWATYDQSIRRNIDTLVTLGAKQIRPLLLAAVHKFNKKQLPRVFMAAVNWSVRVLITGVPSGTFGDAYARAAKEITDGKITTVEELLSDLRSVIPDDKQFEAAAKTANVSQAPLARYYLRALQQYESGGNEAQLIPNSDATQVTLEHILPEEQAGGWTHIKKDVAKAYCNKLGNQALLAGSVNSGLGSAEYSEKETALKASPFSLTKEAAGYTSWGPSEIENRQERLAALAVKTWPLKVK